MLPVHRPLKFSYQICNKVAYGAMDDLPRQKLGWNPLLPTKVRSFHLEENPANNLLDGIRKCFLGQPCLNRPANSLRCSPVSAVRHSTLYKLATFFR